MQRTARALALAVLLAVLGGPAAPALRAQPEEPPGSAGEAAGAEREQAPPTLRERGSEALGRVERRLRDFLGLLPVLGVAFGVFLASLGLARLVGRWQAPWRRLARDEFLRDLLRRVAAGAVVIAGLLVALEFLEATALVGAVLGAAGVMGLALGFAFKDLVENYIAGVLLSLRQPFARGDHVVIDQAEGRVVRLMSRATVLRTMDGNQLRVPNAMVFKSTILNYSRNPERRFSFDVGVGQDEDVAAVQEIARRTLLAMAGVLREPAPQVLVEGLGASNVVLRIRAWVDQHAADFSKTRSEAIRLVKHAFDAAGVSVRAPVQSVRLERAREAPASPAAPDAAPASQADVRPDARPDTAIAAEQETASEQDLLRRDAPQE